MEPETSSSASRKVYDVFLSFRGKDTRQNFTDFLYNIMKTAGILAYRDDDELSSGEKIETIPQAIKNSKICVVVFSKSFASSAWCLNEVAEMVKLKREIIPIFYHVTPDDVKLKTPLYKNDMRALENKHGKDQIRRWEEALKEAVEFKGRELKAGQGYYGFIDQVVKELLIKLKVKRIYVPDRLIGIDNQVWTAEKLLDVEKEDVRILGIHGTGGIGKTTLAKVIFNQLCDSFDCYFFLNKVAELSRNSSVDDMQKLILVNLDHKLKDTIDVTDVTMRIRTNFVNQKVLIVLDDVDRKQQIENLVGNGSWFGSKSRIIVTTRNSSVLDIKGGISCEGVRSQRKNVWAMEMEAMEPIHALQLFSQHAFNVDSPPLQYQSLSSQVVEHSGRLPLALEVIGSLLGSYEDKNFWEETIKQMQKVVNRDFKETLRISFDALEDNEQQIFLDIACFFIDCAKSKPTFMWESCGLSPTVGITILISRSLIKVRENDVFWMHDQLRILGREIAQQRDFKSSDKFRRLWEPKEAIDTLKHSKGKEEIVGLCLDQDCDHNLTGDEFADLSRLRFLSLRTAELGCFEHPLPNLKWLTLHFCRKNFSLTGLSSSMLVVLELQHSYVDEKWRGWSQIQTGELKVLELSHCQSLKRIPNLSRMLNLENLILNNCTSLSEMPGDLGSLENLKWLCLQNCSRIEKLPDSLGKLRSLAKLDLSWARIKELPSSIGGLAELEHLVLKFSDIKKLPESVGDLKSLVALDLSSSHIAELPHSLGRLKRLAQLSLSRCVRLKELPNSLGDLKSLTNLDLSGTAVTTLPASIVMLNKLEKLNAQNSLLHTLPEEIGNLSNMRILNLSGTLVREVPSTISKLSLLEKLVLADCTRIQKLPELPAENLTTLIVMSVAMVEVPNLLKLRNLTELRIFDGSLLRERIRIDSSNLKGIGNLTRLTVLELFLSNITAVPSDLGALSQLKSLLIICPSFKCIPQFPSSLMHLVLESIRSVVKFPNLCHLRSLTDLNISGFVDLSELQLPQALRRLCLGNCRFQSDDFLSNLKNLTRLAIIGCKELVEIPALEELESLEVLHIAFCESLERTGNLSGLHKLVECKAFCCPKLEKDAMFDFQQERPVDDEKEVWESAKTRQRRDIDYLAWLEEPFNKGMASGQEKTEDANRDEVKMNKVHDISLLLSSSDRDYLVNNKGRRIKICGLRGELALYFSASWCHISLMWTLHFKEDFQQLHGTEEEMMGSINAEDEYMYAERPMLVFVSADDDEESFNSFFSLMPWFAIPFEDVNKRQALIRQFNVTELPCMVYFEKDGRVDPNRSLWTINYPKMSYPCDHRRLKESNDRREAARSNQSLRSILVGGPDGFLMAHDGRNKASIPDLEGKVIGLYFSYTSRSCIQFNNTLKEVHKELKAKGKSFEIVLVPPPILAGENSFLKSLGNWYVLPPMIDKIAELFSYFEIGSLPALVIIGSDGNTLNSDAVSAIREHGAAAYPFTEEKLAELKNARATVKSFLQCGGRLSLSPWLTSFRQRKSWKVILMVMVMIIAIMMRRMIKRMWARFPLR